MTRPPLKTAILVACGWLIGLTAACKPSEHTAPDASHREYPADEQDISNHNTASNRIAKSANPESVDTDGPDAAPKPKTESAPDDGTVSVDSNEEVSSQPTAIATEDVPATTEQSNAAILSEPSFRLFIPTQAGPILADIEILLDETDLQTAFDSRLERICQDAAKDPDARLSWESLFQFINEHPEQFGPNVTRLNRNQYRQMIQRYDENRNESPEPSEVAKLIFRNQSATTALRVDGSNYYRNSNRVSSKIFQAIDADGNQELSKEEIDQASNSILRADPNSDQRVDLQELLPTASAMNRMEPDPAWARRRVNRRGEVAMDFGGYVDWMMMSYSLTDCLQQSGPWWDRAFACQLDSNHDDVISKSEAKEVLACDADMRLKFSFGAAPKISLLSTRNDWKRPNVLERSDQLVMSGSGLKLTFLISDRSGQREQAIPREAFDQLDGNGDGGLDESEIPDGIPEEVSIAKLDLDGDEKLSFEEINQRPKEETLPVWASQVRGRGAESPDAVFCWLDENHDQSLSSKEISAAPKKLASCAGNDGTLLPNEFPETYVIHLLRGVPVQDAQNFSLTTRVTSDGPSLPDWGQHMDSNRDGEISFREFLGTEQDFAKLDKNQDGFLNAPEITSDTNQ